MGGVRFSVRGVVRVAERLLAGTAASPAVATEAAILILTRASPVGHAVPVVGNTIAKSGKAITLIGYSIAPIGLALTFVRESLTLVGLGVAHVGLPFAFVRLLLTNVGDTFTLVRISDLRTLGSRPLTILDIPRPPRGLAGALRGESIAFVVRIRAKPPRLRTATGGLAA